MSVTNLPQFLLECRERLERATPGPWYPGPHYGVFAKTHTDYMPGGNGVTYSDVIASVRPYGVDDQALIAHAPTDLDKACKIIEVMQAALEFYAAGNHAISEFNDGGSARKALVQAAAIVAGETK